MKILGIWLGQQRPKPATGLDCGRGLWLANQLCDLVQLRTSGTGTVVRTYVLLPAVG
jgi:hypothetical protein